MRVDEISFKLNPVVDQRFDGIPTELVEQYQDRQALISHLVRHVMSPSKKQELMEEPCSRPKKRVRIHSRQMRCSVEQVKQMDVLGSDAHTYLDSLVKEQKTLETTRLSTIQSSEQ